MENYDFKYKYYCKVRETLDDVSHKQHMRHCNYLYFTKEVCLAALKSDLDNCFNDRNINFIPIAIIDDVLDMLEKITYIPFYGFAEKKPDPQPRYGHSLVHLREVAKQRKEKAAKDPNYYSDDGKTYEQLLEFHGAKDFEEMLFNRFVKVIKREKGWDQTEKEVENLTPQTDQNTEEIMSKFIK